MTEKTTDKKIIPVLTKKLFSTKIEEVQEALKKIPDQGNATLVLPLLRTYKAWPQEPLVLDSIAKILSELKTESAIPELITALEDPDFDEERAMIISIFWNAGLFPVDDIDVLVRHAIRGDYMVTLEVLTVIENIESELDKEQLQNALFDVEDYMEMNPEEPHTELLGELKQVLTTHYNF
jgi:HEAT repeat protein